MHTNATVFHQEHISFDHLGNQVIASKSLHLFIHCTAFPQLWACEENRIDVSRCLVCRMQDVCLGPRPPTPPPHLCTPPPPYLPPRQTRQEMKVFIVNHCVRLHTSASLHKHTHMVFTWVMLLCKTRCFSFHGCTAINTKPFLTNQFKNECVLLMFCGGKREKYEKMSPLKRIGFHNR